MWFFVGIGSYCRELWKFSCGVRSATGLRRIGSLSAGHIHIKQFLGSYLNLRPFSSVFTHESTIYAVSSGHGRCGVAVIRVSGSKTVEVIEKLTKKGRTPQPRLAVLDTLVDYRSGKHLDRALVLWFPKPHSFTGEDVCEFHVHAGSAVIASVFDTLASIKGLRHAEPGDYTKRAFLNNKLDLTEVEGLGDLIHAETEEQRKQALNQMEGRLSNVIKSWSKDLLRALAHVEALIDFGEDQHIEDGILDIVREELKSLCEDIQVHLQDGRRGERLRSGVKVAIIGEPNVGKSSFLNLLSERPAAIVSPDAGTTRDVIQTSLNIGGYPVILSDTAGLRDTTNVVEKEGVKRAEMIASEADLVIYMTDTRRCRGKESILSKAIHFTTEQDAAHCTDPATHTAPPYDKAMIIVNKCDLICNKERSVLLGDLQALPYAVHPMSCKTQDGLDDVLAAVITKVKKLCVGGETSMFSHSLTQARHRTHVSKCLEDIENAISVMHVDIVVGAEFLRLGMNQLGKLTGKIAAEDILDIVFKDFCIGK